MKITIKLTEPSKTNSFAAIKLLFTDTSNVEREVTLNTTFGRLYEFGKETNSVAFDFFLISTIAYGVDCLLERYQYSIDGWARDIEVCFPVSNLDTWVKAQEQVTAILSFLTGDYWSISFVQSPINKYYKKPGRRVGKLFLADKKKYTFASLFSGGLDSLIGVINQLETLPSSDKGFFISHFDPTSPGANRDQESLTRILNVKYKGAFDWLQEKISLSTHDNSGKELNKESSFRSRSLLFIGIGTYCVEHMPNCNTLLIPENGTISVNFPLTPSRSSTLSTRTTHPYYIKKLQDLFSSVGLTTRLENPYRFKTKGEMVMLPSSFKTLLTTYNQSVSCGKRGRKMHWDNKTGTSHCGVCMPCIYRRAALHKKGIDTQLYGIDIFTTRKPPLSIPDMPALFDFLKRGLTREEIKRTLIVNGSFDPHEIDDYASLVERVRIEIKNWIKAKGNNTLKSLAGI
jgi:hypothetical protein